MTKLEQLQAAVFGRLMADPALSTVVILSEQKGVAENDLQTTLGTSAASFRPGAIKGVCIIVGAPSRRAPDLNIPGPRITPDVMVRCMERPAINRGNGGNGLTAEFLTERVEKALHEYRLEHIPCLLLSEGADPETYANLDREYRNHFTGSIQLKPLSKPRPPKISSVGTTVTIVSPSPNTVVTYTTDGSFPYIGNPTAVTVGGAITDNLNQPITDDQGNSITGSVNPFTVAHGTLVLATASLANPTHPDQVASDLAAHHIQ